MRVILFIKQSLFIDSKALSDATRVLRKYSSLPQLVARICESILIFPYPFLASLALNFPAQNAIVIDSGIRQRATPSALSVTKIPAVDAVADTELYSHYSTSIQDDRTLNPHACH